MRRTRGSMNRHQIKRKDSTVTKATKATKKPKVKAEEQEATGPKICDELALQIFAATGRAEAAEAELDQVKEMLKDKKANVAEAHLDIGILLRQARDGVGPLFPKKH